MPQSNGQFRILKNLLPKHKRKTPPQLQDEIPFGRTQTDHMLICDYNPQKGGWQTPEIVPYSPFEVTPDAVVFHYGQEVFEGLKAYRKSASDEIFLFRPEQNARRFVNSALRLGMQPVPEDLFLRCVQEIVAVEQDWILPSPASLYIRPTLIGLDTGVSYRASLSYRFFIIVSPAKNYYSRETGISVYIEREHVRAVPGGCGEAKCGGNYAAALPALQRARAAGSEQVLWLDGINRTFVEEVGAMNIMFVYDNVIRTPALTGSILPGVTRSSIIQLARDLRYTVEECRLNISDVLNDIQSGKLTEIFGCGTAAVISPVIELVDGSQRHEVNGAQIGKVSMHLKKSLIDLQFGRGADPHGWRLQVSAQ
ncbi:MAG: branched-chain amino acid aminotransferase [Betaproteobacteria bacterium]|nr:branched-chain amino acid aminotransferase [Betaproteobacteria bacterium]